MSVQARPPFSYFTDAAGDPLSNGRIYIGTANTDPVANPITVYSDAALTVTVAQPIRTTAGVPVVNGTPVNLYVGGNYAITVKDKNNLLVYTLASAVLAGGDITLAAGETLTAQSGATVDLRSGSTLNLGDSTGAGVVIVVAAPTTITGSLIPSAPGTGELGDATRAWGVAYINDVLSTNVFASNNVYGTEVAGYADTTDPGGPDGALALNQQKNVVACGRISSAAAIGTNHFNIASASVVGTTIVAILDDAVEDDVVIIAQPTGTGAGLEVRAAISALGTTITFVPYSGGVAGVLNLAFVAFGRPRGGVPSPV